MQEIAGCREAPRMLSAVSRAAVSRSEVFVHSSRPVFRLSGGVSRIGSRGSLQGRAMSEEKAAKDAAALG